MKYSEMKQSTIHTWQDIGPTIRSLRQSKNMTGIQLAEQVELSQSKISKIETGTTTPSAKELGKILNILACPKIIRQRMLAVCKLNATIPNAKYRAVVYPPNRALKREQATSHLRYVETHMIPTPLQTTAYRQAHLLRTNISTKEFTHRLNEAEKRQELLWDKKRMFHFILHEASLYTAPDSYDIQLAQLDRLERLCEVKNVKIGILALQMGLPPADFASKFAIYDKNRVAFIFGNHVLESDDPQEIVDNLKIFGELDKKASYGPEAKELIRKAMHFFS